MAIDLDEILSADSRYERFPAQREFGLTLMPHSEIRKHFPFGFEVDNFNPEKLAKIAKNDEFDGRWAFDIKEDDDGKRHYYLFFAQEDSAAYIRIAI